MLISWPLFEAVLKNEKSNKEIVLMTVEWLQCSTLVDFAARLEVPSMISKMIVSGISSDAERSSLVPLFQNLAKHFEQFLTVSVAFYGCFLFVDTLKLVNI